jgi:hypothetical protein
MTVSPLSEEETSSCVRVSYVLPVRMGVVSTTSGTDCKGLVVLRERGIVVKSSVLGAGFMSERSVVLSCVAGCVSSGGGGDDVWGSGPGSLCLEGCRERAVGGGGVLEVVGIVE